MNILLAGVGRPVLPTVFFKSSLFPEKNSAGLFYASIPALILRVVVSGVALHALFLPLKPVIGVPGVALDTGIPTIEHGKAVPGVTPVARVGRLHIGRLHIGRSYGSGTQNDMEHKTTWSTPRSTTKQPETTLRFIISSHG